MFEVSYDASLRSAIDLHRVGGEACAYPENQKPGFRPGMAYGTSKRIGR